jgi:gas vesicle protein
MNKLLIGLLGGIVLGVLFAPAKGSVTRKQLRASFDSWKDTVLTDMEDFNTELKELGQTIKADVDAASGKTPATV